MLRFVAPNEPVILAVPRPHRDRPGAAGARGHTPVGRLAAGDLRPLAPRSEVRKPASGPRQNRRGRGSLFVGRLAIDRSRRIPAHAWFVSRLDRHRRSRRTANIQAGQRGRLRSSHRWCDMPVAKFVRSPFLCQYLPGTNSERGSVKSPATLHLFRWQMDGDWHRSCAWPSPSQRPRSGRPPPVRIGQNLLLCVLDRVAVIG